MSRHIKAQATPTHASGFQLFTVAMTGHAEEWVQLLQQKVAVWIVVVLMQYKEQEQESGIYRNAQGGCFPDRTTKGYGSSDRYSGTPSGVEPIKKKRWRRSTHKQMQQNDAWTWHVQMLVFGLMQDATKLVEAHLNPRFKCNSKWSI